MDTHKNLAEFLPVITDDEDDDILFNEPPLSNDEKVLLQRCDLLPSNATETTETTIKETMTATSNTAPIPTSNDADGRKTPVVEVADQGDIAEHADVGDHTEAPVTKSAAVDAIKLPSYDPDDGVRISCKLVLPKEDRYDMSFNLHRMLHLLVEYMRGVSQVDVQVTKNLTTSCCGCLRDKLMCTHDDAHNTKVHDVVRLGNSIEGYVFLAMWRPGRVSRPKSRHGHSILVHVTNQDQFNDEEEADWTSRTLCWEGVSGQVPLAQVSDTLLLPNLSRMQLLILGCIAAMGIVCTEQGRCANRKRIACVVQGYDDIQDVVLSIIQRVSGHKVTKNLFADDNDESSAPKRTSTKRKRNHDIETNIDEPSVLECPPSSCVVPREKLQLLYSRLCTWKAWAERKLAQ